MKKSSSDKIKPAIKSVTLCIGSKTMVLNGMWRWDMQSDALYISDVMSFPPDFEGTKGIFHPDDLANVRSAVELLSDSEIEALDFRVITTYGEVRNIRGQRLSLEKSNPGQNAEEGDAPWEGALQDLALRREAEFLLQRKELSDTAESVYGIGSWAVNKITGEAWYSDGVYKVHGLPVQSLNAHAATFNSFVHPDDRTTVLEAWEKAWVDEVPVHLEYRILLPDGATRHLRQITQWSFNQKGQPLFSGVVRDLTEEYAISETAMAAEAATKLHQQVLKFSEQNWNTGHWFLNLITRKVSYSDNYYRLYGLKQAQLPGNNAFLSLVHPDDRDRVQELTEGMYRTHELPETEFRIIRPDGKQRQLKQSGKLIVTSNSSLMMIGMVQDVTVLRGLEKKIAELNERAALHDAIAMLAENISETSSLIWHPGDGTVNWSDGFYRLLGYRPDGVEPIQKLFYKQVHPEDLERLKDAETLVLNGQAHDDVYFRIVNKSGVRELRLTFNRVATGNREVVVGVVKELGKENLLRKKLEETTAFAEKLNDAISDAIIVTDTNNNVVGWNATATDKTGIKKEEALYANLFDLFPGLHNERYLEQLQSTLQGKEATETKATERYFRKPHRYYLAPIKNAKGNVVNVLHVVRDISKELELQQQLSERLSFIESLVEASVDRIVVLDRHMNYLYWNRKAEEYYSITKEKVIGRNILEIFPGFRNDPSYDEFRKVLRGETVYLPANQQAGSYKYFETYLIPVKDDRKEVTSILWIVHDLSKEFLLQQEQRRAQQLLAEEHHRLKEAQAVGRVGSFTWEVGSEVSFWSEELYRINGLEPGSEEITLNIVDRFIHPGDFAELQRLKETSLLQAGKYGLVHRIVLRNGEERWVNHQWESIAGENSAVVRVTGVVQDITELKRSEERIKEQSHFLQRILETGPDMISLMDLTTHQTRYLNEEVFEAHGFGHQYMGGKSPEELRETIHADDQPVMAAYFQALTTATDEQIVSAEYRAKNSGGEWKWFSVRSKVFQRDPGGKPTQALNVIEEITGRKKAEQEIKESKELLQGIVNAPSMSLTVLKAMRNESGEMVDFRMQFANSRSLEAFGGKDPTGTLVTTYGSDGIEQFAYLKKVVEEGKKITYTKKAETASGEGWFLFSAAPLGNDRVMQVWEDITEIKKAEQQIIRLKEEVAQKATDKYYSIFNVIGEGFCIYEMVYEGGKAVDLRWLEVNPAYEKHMGVKDINGKLASEVMPGAEKYWIDIYEKVANAGEAVQFESWHEPTGRWFRVFASRTGGANSRQVAVVFDDITERKQREQHQQFVLQLSDALHALSDPVEIVSAAAHMTMNYLKADRCYYIEMDGNNAVVRGDAFCEQLSSVAGVYSLTALPVLRPFFLTNGPLIASDVADDDLLDEPLRQFCIDRQVIAFMNLPVVKNGILTGRFCVTQRTQRKWENIEIELATDAAERTWAALERAKAEEALRQSEDSYRTALEREVAQRTAELEGNQELMQSVFDASLHAIILFRAIRDVNGNVLDYEVLLENAVTQRWNGRSLIGERYAEEFPQIRKLGIFSAYNQVLATGEPMKMNVKYEGEGLHHWYTITAVKVNDNELVASAENITEQKMAEEEIKKNLTILQNTEELAQIGSWEYDIASGRFHWSEGMYRLFGLRQGSKVHPEAYLEFSLEEDRSIAKHIVKSLKKTHRPFEETLQIKRGGEVRLLKIKGLVVNDENGTPKRMVGVDLDITDIRNAEAKIKESRRWLEQTALASPDAISVYDLRIKQPVYLNDCLAKWIGTTSEELLKMGIDGRLELVYPDDRLKLLHFNEMLKAAGDGEVLMLEYRLRTKKDMPLWIRNRSKVFQRDAHGTVTHLLSFLQDVTEEKAAEDVLKRLNASLEKKNQELEQKNDEITSFAFVASHDLKEPLRKIHTFSDWLLTKEDSLSKEGKLHLQRVSAAVRRLDLLIDDILALTKVHVGNERLKPVDLNALLQQVNEEMQEKLEKTGAVIETGALPTITGVENQLFYLFKNLIGNAVKFQPEGNQPVIRIRAGKEGEFLKITVADNGLGIAKEYHKKIFEMFRRLHGREEFDGTGMGLAICKKIMEKHGGKITVESEEGKGAVFICWFPAALSTMPVE